MLSWVILSGMDGDRVRVVFSIILVFIDGAEGRRLNCVPICVRMDGDRVQVAFNLLLFVDSADG